MSSGPMVSVLIPSRDNRVRLQRVLESIARCRFDRARVQVCVADDGSTDGTRELLEGSSYPFVLDVVRGDWASSAAATNAALARANGTYVLGSASDCRFSAELIATHVERHERASQPLVVLGALPWEPGLAADPFRYWLSQGGAQFSFDTITDPDDVDPSRLYASNFSVRRDTLVKLGGFDESFTAACQDTDLGIRLARSGLRIVFERDAVAWHDHPVALRPYMLRQRLAGEAYVRLAEKYPDIRELQVPLDRLLDPLAFYPEERIGPDEERTSFLERWLADSELDWIELASRRKRASGARVFTEEERSLFARLDELFSTYARLVYRPWSEGVLDEAVARCGAEAIGRELFDAWIRRGESPKSIALARKILHRHGVPISRAAETASGVSVASTADLEREVMKVSPDRDRLSPWGDPEPSIESASPLRADVETGLACCRFESVAEAAVGAPEAVDDATVSTFGVIALSHLGRFDDARRLLEAREPIEPYVASGPLVSVIVPTFERRDLLRRALASIAGQHYRPIEAVVVNDGGASVSDVVDAFRDTIRVVEVDHEANRYIARARNSGVERASGEWIAFLDDDDVLYPHHLGHLVALASRDGSELACGASLVHDRGRGARGEEILSLLPRYPFAPRRLLERKVAPIQALVISAALAARVGPFDPALLANEDWDFTIRACLDARGVSQSAHPTSCVEQRHGSQRITGRSRAPFLASCAAIYRRFEEPSRAEGVEILRAQTRAMEALRFETARQLVRDRRVQVLVSDLPDHELDRPGLARVLGLPYGAPVGGFEQVEVVAWPRDRDRLLRPGAPVDFVIAPDRMAPPDAPPGAAFLLCAALDADPTADVAVPTAKPRFRRCASWREWAGHGATTESASDLERGAVLRGGVVAALVEAGWSPDDGRSWSIACERLAARAPRVRVSSEVAVPRRVMASKESGRLSRTHS